MLFRSQARELFADAKAMLQKIVDERWLQAKAVVGIWPANRDGDDVVVEAMPVGAASAAIFSSTNMEQKLAAEAAPTGEARTSLHFLRQQAEKPVGERPNLCLADFIAPSSSGKQDWIGGFAVTAGHGIDAHVARFEADHDDYSAIMLKALADRLAEALAERMHERVRHEVWEIGRASCRERV